MKVLLVLSRSSALATQVKFKCIQTVTESHAEPQLVYYWDPQVVHMILMFKYTRMNAIEFAHLQLLMTPQCS